LGGVPSSPVSLADLSVDAARHALDTFNPSYVKVIEFYGLYYPDQRPPRNTCIAYVSLTNPSEKEQKMLVYEAHFKRLIKADGQGQWYLTGLLTHSSGLSKRLGWDNLMSPVK
jgi:hypothetical protein